MSQETGIRLNKYLASCGVGSRRACDALILEGKVLVNNGRCDNPATRVSSDDVVRVGRKIVTPKSSEVVLFYKPPGLVCTTSDELGRETIYHALPHKLRHLKNVGRLDKESEGLLVMTNDGELAMQLTHPSMKVQKEYLVTLNQAFANEVIDQLVQGVHTPEGRARAVSIRRISPRRAVVVLETGLKRQIRHMFDAVHLKVTRLVRTRIGMLGGSGLEPGKWRYLDAAEIEALQKNPPSRKIPGDVKRAARKRPARKAGIKLARKQAGNTAKKQGQRRSGARPPKKVFRRRKN